MHRTHRRRWRIGVASAVALAAFAGTGITPSAAAPFTHLGGHDRRDEDAFAHVSTFDVRDNGTTVAEIVNATKDGRTLVYTDSPPARSVSSTYATRSIRSPRAPSPSAANQRASASPTSTPSSRSTPATATSSRPLFVIDLRTRMVVRTIDLGGQPARASHRTAATPPS